MSTKNIVGEQEEIKIRRFSTHIWKPYIRPFVVRSPVSYSSQRYRQCNRRLHHSAWTVKNKRNKYKGMFEKGNS